LRSFEEHRVVNRIYHVADGEAALDYLLQRADYINPADCPRPHIILLDLRLPKIDGLEVLKRIKSTPDLETIPVIVLTTSATERDVVKAYEAHANSYLVKPVDFDKFTTLMDELGFYWLGWNHYPWAAK
jgi:CheY-like chemotaxis protein